MSLNVGGTVGSCQSDTVPEANCSKGWATDWKSSVAEFCPCALDDGTMDCWDSRPFLILGLWNVEPCC